MVRGLNESFVAGNQLKWGTQLPNPNRTDVEANLISFPYFLPSACVGERREQAREREIFDVDVVVAINNTEVFSIVDNFPASSNT